MTPPGFRVCLLIFIHCSRPPVAPDARRWRDRDLLCPGPAAFRRAPQSFALLSLELENCDFRSDFRSERSSGVWRRARCHETFSSWEKTGSMQPTPLGLRSPYPHIAGLRMEVRDSALALYCQSLSGRLTSYDVGTTFEQSIFQPGYVYYYCAK